MGSALEKFLQRGGGAFHHLACGDAVDQLLVQRAYWGRSGRVRIDKSIPYRVRGDMVFIHRL